MNIPKLVAALQELTTVSKNTSDDFYFGRWPIEVIRAPKRKNGLPVGRIVFIKLMSKILFLLGPECGLTMARSSKSALG